MYIMANNNIQTINFHIHELDTMKKYPKELFYIGNTDLLKKRKVSIVGTRRPNSYAIQKTHEIARKLSFNNIVIVSGVAMGIDAIAHEGARSNNTIGVTGNGLDIKYPAINKKIIKSIEKNGLMLSQFKPSTPSFNYNFPIRNEVVVALGEVLIVAQADMNSGTIRSVEHALKMDKKIYALPHRVGESEGTNELIRKNLAIPIYDVDKFVKEIVGKNSIGNKKDKFLKFCSNNPTYDEVVEKFPSKIFEYELSGKIKVEKGLVFVV